MYIYKCTQFLVLLQAQANVRSNALIPFAEFDTVSEAFVFLTSQLKLLLAKTDFSDIKRSCIEQINTPSGAQLPPELVEKVNLCTNITMLFEVLAQSPYWSWIDVRLLKVMAAASGLMEAIQLLSNYKKAIFSKKLFDILPNAPSKKVKEEYYTKIVTKINKKPNEMTVADLLEFQSELETVIMDITKGVCILEHLEKGCIEIHWYIPTSCVDKAYQTARVRCYQFKHLHLLYLKIGHYPVIHDPLSLPDLVSAPSLPVHLGKLCNIILLACVLLFCHIATVKDFVSHYYDYLSVNMDAEVVTQLMVSQQLLSEDIVMAASSDYQKNCLILEQVILMNVDSLVSFAELLMTNDSQSDIAKVLSDGK